MANVFEKPSDMSEYLFRIVDNGGQTADRYMVMFTDGSFLGLSASPSHPQGFSQWGEGMDPAMVQEWIDDGEVVDLALGDLPEGLAEHIMARNNQGLEDFLARVEAKEPYAVAPSRRKAEANEGIHDSLGKGIYASPEGYRVRLDGDPEDDRGPYDTAREVVLATIPDAHGFAGEEYHSTTDVARMEPNAEIKAKVAELEARREADWNASRGM